MRNSQSGAVSIWVLAVLVAVVASIAVLQFAPAWAAGVITTTKSTIASAAPQVVPPVTAKIHSISDDGQVHATATSNAAAPDKTYYVSLKDAANGYLLAYLPVQFKGLKNLSLSPSERNVDVIKTYESNATVSIAFKVSPKDKTIVAAISELKTATSKMVASAIAECIRMSPNLPNPRECDKYNNYQPYLSPYNIFTAGIISKYLILEVSDKPPS